MTLSARFLSLIFLLSCIPSVISAKEQPNFIFILMDDMSPSAVGCYAEAYGEVLVPTPHIDALAANGMRFTDAYVTPQCTPTRATLITGQYTARNRMWHVSPRYCVPNAYLTEPPYLENLPREAYTLAEALKDNGYTTAVMGKWHINVWGPLEDDPDGYYVRLFADRAHHYGFDVTDSSEQWGQTFNYPGQNDRINDKGVDFLTDETLRFIEANQDRPFFVYLSHHTLHGKIMAPQELVDKYIALGFSPDIEAQHNAIYAASIEHMDNSIGRLMEGLDELGLTDNTYIIYMSDNGGVDHLWDAFPFREGKGSPYEGGIRSPLIVHKPGSVPAGSVNTTPVHIVDLYPTLVELAGGTMEQDWILDGRSLAPEFHRTGTIERESLFWYQPLYDMGWGSTPTAGVRQGKYKLLWHLGDSYDTADNVDTVWDALEMERYEIGSRIELFDLEADISESMDIAAKHPAIVARMMGALHDWLEDSGAQMPFANPYFDLSTAFDRTNGEGCHFPPFIEAHPKRFDVTGLDSFAIDLDFYRSLNPGGALDITVHAAHADTLPGWLQYNPGSRRLSGKAPAGTVLELLVTIADSRRYVITDTLTIISQP